MSKYDPELHATRICASCKIRYRLHPANVPTNFDMLPIDRKTWEKLRRAAEAFDRAASNLEEEEGHGGTGDGETLFPAAAFVEWLKPDCEGFRSPSGGMSHQEYDGVRGGRPFELPQAGRMTRDAA